jgi:hypothetical protein
MQLSVNAAKACIPLGMILKHKLQRIQETGAVTETEDVQCRLLTVNLQKLRPKGTQTLSELSDRCLNEYDSYISCPTETYS